MIVNIDKTQLKYVSVEYFTLAEKGEASVTMEESNNKRCITAIFGICLNSIFLPIRSPYIQNEKQILNLSETRKHLVITDVFASQMTNDVRVVLYKRHVCVANVPVIIAVSTNPLT